MSEIKPEVLKTLRSDVLGKVNQGSNLTYAFNVDFTDINPTFIGKFIVHRPSQMQRMQIGVTKSVLLGGNLNVDTMTDNIAHIIATLDNVLDHKPDWFNVFDPMLDYDILESVYLEYTKWMDTFRRGGKNSQPIGGSEVGGSSVPVVDTDQL